MVKSWHQYLHSTEPRSEIEYQGWRVWMVWFYRLRNQKSKEDY